MRGAARALLAVALATALAAPAPAAAAEATGNTTLVVSAAKARVLAERGITLSGVRGAVSEGRETRLQISGGTVGSDSAQLSHQGALRLVAGEGGSRRVVRLSGLQTQLDPSSTLSARLKGKRRVIFDLEAKPGTLSFDGLRGIASLHSARLVWRGAAARLIGKRLGAAIPRGAPGTVRTSAATTATGTPTSGPISTAELPLMARPASAIDVSGATVTWHVRSSWINYVATGAGTSAIEGAAPGPAVPESSHPCLDDEGGDTEPRAYAFTFPFANGWYDAASGTAAIYTTGGTHFRFPGHGIDLITRNPEIEVNGGASRAIFRLDGAGSTSYGNARAAILDLGLPGAPVEGPAGTFTFTDEIKGHLSADGLSIFGGFYAPPNNHGFGCFSVSFSTG
jgi:hypothetical protein